MNISKIFPMWLHLIAGSTLIAVAFGLDKLQPGCLSTYTVVGFATGVGIAFFWRLMGGS